MLLTRFHLLTFAWLVVVFSVPSAKAAEAERSVQAFAAEELGSLSPAEVALLNDYEAKERPRGSVRADVLAVILRYESRRRHPRRWVEFIQLDIQGDLDLRWESAPFVLSMSNCNFYGRVLMGSAKFHAVEFIECQLQRGMEAAELEAKSFLFYESTSEGLVDLSRANVRGDCTFWASSVNADGKRAVSADSSSIQNNLIFQDFVAHGGLWLPATRVGGQVQLVHSDVRASVGSHAVFMQGAECSSVLIEEDSVLYGSVVCSAMRIRGSVVCRDCTLRCDKQSTQMSAFMGNGMEARVAMFSDVQVVGAVRFVGARVLDTLAWKRVTHGPDAFPEVPDDGEEAEEAESMAAPPEEDTPSEDLLPSEAPWREHPVHELELVLRGADIHRLVLDLDSVPRERFEIVGCEYEILQRYDKINDDDHENDEKLPCTRDQITDLLGRQRRFSFQPYEHMATVLRSEGRAEDATAVLISREERRLEQMSGAVKFKHWVLGSLIGFGHRPWRALWIGLVIIVSGSLIFGRARRRGLLVPCNSGARRGEPGTLGQGWDRYHPRFLSLVYSVDVFVPLVDLHLARHWMPNASMGSRLPLLNMRTGGAVRCWTWFQHLAGWILTTFFFAGLTGLVNP